MGTRITRAERSANPNNCQHYADEPSGAVEVVCAPCLAERGRIENAQLPREQRGTWMRPAARRQGAQ